MGKMEQTKELCQRIANAYCALDDMKGDSFEDSMAAAYHQILIEILLNFHSILRQHVVSMERNEAENPRTV